MVRVRELKTHPGSTRGPVTSGTPPREPSSKAIRLRSQDVGSTPVLQLSDFRWTMEERSSRSVSPEVSGNLAVTSICPSSLLGQTPSWPSRWERREGSGPRGQRLQFSSSLNYLAGTVFTLFWEPTRDTFRSRLTESTLAANKT